MQKARRLTAVLLAVGNFFASVGFASAEDSMVRTVKPYQGIMLDVGSKQRRVTITSAAAKSAQAYRSNSWNNTGGGTYVN